jgi:hypothetical protein
MTLRPLTPSSAGCSRGSTTSLRFPPITQRAGIARSQAKRMTKGAQTDEWRFGDRVKTDRRDAQKLARSLQSAATRAAGSPTSFPHGFPHHTRAATRYGTACGIAATPRRGDHWSRIQLDPAQWSRHIPHTEGQFPFRPTWVKVAIAVSGLSGSPLALVGEALPDAGIVRWAWEYPFAMTRYSLSSLPCLC